MDINLFYTFLLQHPLSQKRPKTTRKESRLVELDKLILQNGGNPIDMIFDKEGGM